MRFCTTCGRNFEGDLPECPHDGTPLFDMGAPTKEPLLAAASEPWAATSSSDVSAEIGLVDFESRSKEFPSPISSGELEVPVATDIDFAPAEEESPIDLGAALFDDDADQLSGGTSSVVEEISVPEVNIAQEEEVILDDALAPIEVKSSGGSKLLPILLLLLVAGGAGFYFLGGGKEMLSRSTETPKIAIPEKKVVEKPVEKPIEKPIEKVEVDEKTEEIEGKDETAEKDEKEAAKNGEENPGTEKVKVEEIAVEKKVEEEVIEKKIEPVKKVKKRVRKKKKVETVEKVEEIVPEKKVVPKKKVRKKKVVDDAEELLRKELEAMGGG